MANEITDPRERQVTLEPPGELEHLAQVEERSGASVSLSPELSPAQVSALLEQPVQDVGDCERIAQQADAIGELDQPHGLSRHLRVCLRKSLAPRLIEAIAQPHALSPEATRGEPVHPGVWQTDDRTLQQPDQRAVVHRILGEAQQSQDILDLLTVEETRAAARDVGNALAPELVLKIARQHAHGVGEDCDVTKRSPAHVQAPDRFGHGTSLGSRVGRHEHADWCRSAFTAGRDQVRFVGKVWISADEVGRAVEDALVRASVVGQRQAQPGKEAADVVDLGVAPSVDRLFGVAYRGDIAECLGRGKTDEVELDAVGVLELVDDEVAKALAAAVAEFGHSFQGVDDLEEQVVEVAQALLAQAVLVRAVDREENLDRLQLRTSAPVLRVQVGCPLAKPLGADAAALELEQEAKTGAEKIVEVVDRERGERVGVERSGRAAAQLCDQLLLEELLPCLVQDTHLAGCADQICELVEQARADAVKGADPAGVQNLCALRAPGELLRRQVRAARAQLRCDAQSKLFGGPVAECQREDLVGRDALLDEPAEALRRSECFSGARAGSNQECPLRACVRGRCLLWAQAGTADPQGAHSGGAPP